nr:unnamed protein product [Digitaria exilis]
MGVREASEVHESTQLVLEGVDGSMTGSSCSEALKEKVPRITEKLTWAASLVAIGMGLALLVGQFFGFSLY